MDERKERMEKILQDYDLGALIFWRPDELVMAFGYQPYFGLSFGVVTALGTFLYIPENEPMVDFAEEITVKTFSLGMDVKNPWDLLFARIEADLKVLGLACKKVGYVPFVGGSALTTFAAEQPVLPDDLLERLAALGAGGSDDCATAIKRLYEVKSAHDIAAIRLANQVAARGVDAFFTALSEGAREIEVRCAIEHAIACQIGKDDVRFARGWAQVQSGKNAVHGGRYNTTTGKALKNGELVLLELGVCVNGYWADISRTGFVGDVPAEVNRYYDLVEEAQENAIRHICAGVPAGQVYAAASEVFARVGCLDLFPHALGHGVGFRYHEFNPGLTPHNGVLLTAGMTLTVEPGIYSEKFGGIRVEDNILVTETGGVLLSCAKRGLKGQRRCD